MNLLNEIAAGGQTWAHRVRMIRQVMKIVLVISFLSSFGILSYRMVKNIPSAYYQAFWYHSKASLFEVVKVSVDVEPKTWEEASQTYYRGPYSPKKVMRVFKPSLDLFSSQMATYVKQAIIHFFLFNLFFIIFFLIRGQSSKKKKHLSGIEELSDRSLALRLWIKRKAAEIKLGRVPLLKEKVQDHVLICGVTGSGKSNCLMQILRQIRQRGDRAVVVDTTGGFVSCFYREEQDVLINPYDQRSVRWDPWCECTKDYHYEQLVNSLIPSMEYFDNFFPEAARAVLYSALRRAAVLGETDILDFVSSMLRKSIGELYEDLKDTDAAVYVDPKGDKTTVSVRATISNSIRHFRPLKRTKKPFSIRNWILDDSIKDQIKDQWLFISCTTEQRKSINNLMSVWFSVAINAMKAKDPNKKPSQIWFIIDELHSLQKLEYLEEALVEIRKYGGTLVLATQNLSQIDKIYGQHSTRSMIDQCGTKVCFRQGESDIALRMSKFFGEEEISEVQEGLSYGAHEMRDGVSLSKVKKYKPTISPSKIMELENLSAYIKLPGKHPAVKTKFKYRSPDKICEPCKK